MPKVKPSFHREEGIAMITAILISGVILTLSITAASLAVHNTDQSGLDRNRTQVIATAEAGVNVAFSTLQTTATASLPCSIAASSTASPSQQYTVAIQYFNAAGAQLTCNNPGLSSAPATALITSTGNSLPALSNPSAKRTMQSQVALHPVYGGFDSAIFSDSSPSTNNNITVNGSSGDDADVYTNGSWNCANSMTVHGQMIAQGSVTMSNSCQVTKDVWANGAVSMSNSAVAGHNVTSSTSSISLSNSAHILNNATAGTTISSGNIDGTKTPNHPQAAPAAKSLPTMTFSQTAWQDAGWTVVPTTCSAVQSLTSTPSTKTVYRITPACAISWSNNSTLQLGADAAIVTDGSISSANQTTIKSSAAGTTRTLYWIVPTGSACPGGNLSTSNNTSFVDVRTFMYTPCAATYSNNNAGVGGQIFAGSVAITNQFTLNFAPEVVPGAGTITGYKVDIAYLREIVNP
jgi:hypothetical protein